MGLETPRSLLEKIRDPGDDGAWRRFYGFYAPLIVGFCLQKGCPRDMADDVLQETMMALLRQMPTFVYDASRGRFRSYLLKIVHRLIIKAWRRGQRAQFVDCGSGTRRLEGVVDVQVGHPADEWDALFDRRLLDAALERVRERVGPQVYRSFELTAIQGLPVPKVMAELGIPSANAVHQHRHRVKAYLREIMAELRREVDQ